MCPRTCITCAPLAASLSAIPARLHPGCLSPPPCRPPSWARTTGTSTPAPCPTAPLCTRACSTPRRVGGRTGGTAARCRQAVAAWLALPARAALSLKPCDSWPEAPTHPYAPTPTPVGSGPLLQGPEGRAVRDAFRHLPPPLLHQHCAQVAAGAAHALPGPQRWGMQPLALAPLPQVPLAAAAGMADCPRSQGLCLAAAGRLLFSAPLASSLADVAHTLPAARRRDQHPAGQPELGCLPPGGPAQRHLARPRARLPAPLLRAR